MSWYDNLFGNSKSNYYVNTGKGLAATNIDTTNAGGIGTYGYIKDSNGNYTGVDEGAYNAIKQTNPGDLYTSDQMKEISNQSGSGGASGMSTAAGLVGAGASVMSAITGMQNLGLAKKQFEYEKALGNANLYNSGTVTNNAILNQAKVGNALAGDSMTAAQKTASLADAQSKFVKTTI